MINLTRVKSLASVAIYRILYVSAEIYPRHVGFTIEMNLFCYPDHVIEVPER